jgi:antitoxin ParD1/3/4
MQISLLPDLEALIRRKVDSGEYESPSDVVIHALYLLDAHDRVRQQRLEDLRREIAVGIEQCERGETEVLTEATIKRVAARGRKRLAKEAERLRAEADRLAENAKLPVDETASAD